MIYICKELKFYQMIQVGVIMGSNSDLPIMQGAIDILKQFNVKVEVDIVSAHRTPEKLFDYAKNAHKKGLKVIIAGAGGAAHLPGMVASMSPLPVIGVPIKSRNSIDGWDSVLSILQMPSGVPVATVALDGATNAGILAAQIIGASNNSVQERVIAYKESLKEKVINASKELKK
jgi:5-(carboxyamino)imidazole ribonucleotide mutase